MTSLKGMKFPRAAHIHKRHKESPDDVPKWALNISRASWDRFDGYFCTRQNGKREREGRERVKFPSLKVGRVHTRGGHHQSVS